uniref:Uncharacterized protein n=1 Tax=Anguilla anguilla TaxID=7936 RepID=A0A0E9XYA8_ANGAN
MTVQLRLKKIRKKDY